MELDEAIGKLKAISSDAKALHKILADLAKAGKEASSAQTDAVAKLAKALEDESRAAAAARRRAEIAQLTEVVKAHETTLTIPSLPKDVRDAVDGDLVATRARLARLTAQEGTDFNGMLSAAEIANIVTLAAKASQEVQQKKLAAAFLSSLVQIADVAFSIAAKLAI